MRSHCPFLLLFPVVLAGLLTLQAEVSLLDLRQYPRRYSDVTVRPKRINDVLTNPNMGFADFHMGWHCESPGLSVEDCVKRRGLKWPENYPETAVTYFRWYWDQLEPEEGAIDFNYIDTRIRASNATGQTLSFRVMAIREGGVGIPSWLRKKVKGVEVGRTFWPDYRDPVFQQAHRRFVQALGQRYDGHPAVDHIDIGPVGCWGEWNTACIQGVSSLIEILRPADDAERGAIAAGYQQIIADYADAFQHTPLVMLGLADNDEWLIQVMGYAFERGTGWRVDCWGDWSYFSPNWSHHTQLYPRFMANARRVYPDFDNIWKRAPVQLEVCGTIQQWHERGWSADPPDGAVYKTFQFAIEHHAAVLNGKRGPIPQAYLPAVNNLLKRIGYRYGVDEFSHPASVQRGEELRLRSTWSNLGVTPSYTPRTVAYRLRGQDAKQQFESNADVRRWLPGTWQEQVVFTVPAELPAGTYHIELAILDRPGVNPVTEPLPPLQLAIEGRRDDGWYPLSRIEVK
jgi:hypothetical protein